MAHTALPVLELGTSVGIPASRVVALLDELVERGFVSRRTHETDRRVRLAGTDAGRAELAELNTIARRFDHQVEAGPSDEDKAELRRLLLTVYGNIGAEGSEGAGLRAW